MARKLRIVLGGLVAVGLLLSFGAWSASRAVRHVRPFYRQALTVDRTVLEAGKRDLETKASALYSDAGRPGEWNALFTAEQLNGWLAVEFAENHADVLPKGVADPRLAIGEELLTLGFRTQRGPVNTVVSVDAKVFLTDPNVVGLRIVAVRAGMVPMPMGKVLDEVARTSRSLKYPVKWIQQNGEPVALIEIGENARSAGRRIVLESVELHEGAIYLAGRTELAALETDAVASGPTLEEESSGRGDVEMVPAGLEPVIRTAAASLLDAVESGGGRYDGTSADQSIRQ